MKLSNIGGGDAERITVRGYDLVGELMDKRDFVDMTCLMISGELPTPNQRRMINLFLVTSADHGLTPSALATRLTLHGAPESIQGAVAAGLLGAGSRYLGASEHAARYFQHALEKDAPKTWTAQALRERAEAAVSASREKGEKVPGIGHPIHVGGDPRVEKLLEVAAECGYRGVYSEFALELAQAISRKVGRTVPINAAGIKGAIILDMGMKPELAKGLTLISRVAGLLAHIVEEQAAPVGQQLWDMAVAAERA